MKTLILALTILILNSCTMYRPVHMGTSNYSGKHVKDCSTHFIGMTGDPDGSRLDYVMNKFNLEQEDVYTVEEELFHFLYPLFAKTCTVISLNQDGVKKYMQRHKNGSHKAMLSKAAKK